MSEAHRERARVCALAAILAYASGATADRQAGVSVSAGMTRAAVEQTGDLEWFAEGELVVWGVNAVAGGLGVAEAGEDPLSGAGIRFHLAPNLPMTGSFRGYELNGVELDVSTLGLSLRF